MEINKFTNYKKKILWVGDEHRKHPWSIREGGCTVVVEYLKGQILGYDKVKRPYQYMGKIFRGDKNSIYHSQPGDFTFHKYLSTYVKELGIAKEGDSNLDSLWKNGDEDLSIEILDEYKTE